MLKNSGNRVDGDGMISPGAIHLTISKNKGRSIDFIIRGDKIDGIKYNIS